MEWEARASKQSQCFPHGVLISELFIICVKHKRLVMLWYDYADHFRLIWAFVLLTFLWRWARHLSRLIVVLYVYVCQEFERKRFFYFNLQIGHSEAQFPTFCNVVKWEKKIVTNLLALLAIDMILKLFQRKKSQHSPEFVWPRELGGCRISFSASVFFSFSCSAQIVSKSILLLRKISTEFSTNCKFSLICCSA